jgi:glutamate 5-kinase
VAKLVRSGKQVIVVTSGAVGLGRQKLHRQSFFRQSVADLMASRREYVTSSFTNRPAIVNITFSFCSTSAVPLAPEMVSYKSACAAAGQLGIVVRYWRFIFLAD